MTRRVGAYLSRGQTGVSYGYDGAVILTLSGLEPTGDAMEVERVLLSDGLAPLLLTLQIPQATVHPSLSAPWLAWQSIPLISNASKDEKLVVVTVTGQLGKGRSLHLGRLRSRSHDLHRSIMWLRQIAQLSTTMSEVSQLP